MAREVSIFGGRTSQPPRRLPLTKTRRVSRELTTGEWQSILDKAWAAGIPHITFTGGEPTLRDDLPALIAHAEKNGQVCGLLSDGLKLADKEYLDVLLKTGLDHLLFILQPDDKNSWQALETIMPEDLFTTVHLTVTPRNSRKADEVLEKSGRMGVQSLSLSSTDASLKERMQFLRNQAHALGLTLRWDLPVPYSADNPVADEVVDDASPGWRGKSLVLRGTGWRCAPRPGRSRQGAGQYPERRLGIHLQVN